MREEILAMLKSSSDYVSGQEICEKLSVSRTAIWKAIHSLQKKGYQIEAVRNRGYRLVACPDILLSEEIKQGIRTSWWGRDLAYYTVTDSTNLRIRQMAEEGASEGALAIAEEQTAGRGRRGRSWLSEPGENIYMSYLLRPRLDPAKASMITLVNALAMAHAVRKVTGLDAQIKWPNDIVVNGRKVVGILTEMSTEMTQIQYIVVGIGVNVNQRSFPVELSASASSLANEKQEDVKRADLVIAFGEAFEKYYEEFLRYGDLSSLREEYDRLLVNCGREVYLLEGDNRVRRRALGINEEGELLVLDDAGHITGVRFGEVSVRGLYGYV